MKQNYLKRSLNIFLNMYRFIKEESYKNLIKKEIKKLKDKKYGTSK